MVSPSPRRLLMDTGLVARVSSQTTASYNSNMNVPSQKAPSLSDIAQSYARSLADPFEGPLARVPDTPTLNTAVRRYFKKGTFSTSTDSASLGQGYIWCNPLNGLTSDLWPVVYNTPASATVQLNGMVITPDATGGPSNGEYASTALPDGFGFKIVSAGLRIRYAGNQLTRGGTIASLHEPTHSSLAGFKRDDLLAYVEGAQDSINEHDGWHTLLYRAVDEDDFDFRTTFPAYAAANGGYMGFWINSWDTGGTNVQTFEYQFFGNYELLGSTLAGKQPSHSDSTGHSAVMSVVTSSNAFTKSHKKEGGKLGHALVHASSDYVDHHSSATGMQHKKKSKKSSSNWYDGLLSLVPGAISAIGTLL